MMFLNQIYKNRKWFAINTIGISLAFAAILIVFSFVRNELSFDRFHSKADEIYRINFDKPLPKEPVAAELLGEYVFPLYENFPAIQDIVRLYTIENSIVKTNNDKFYPTNAFYTSRSFFNVFDFKLIQGNKENLFSHPKEVAISKKAALAYFGTTDAIGKELHLQDQYKPKLNTYTVTAVMEDFPANSHFQADVLFSVDKEQDRKTVNYSYTYLLVQKGTQVPELKKTINNYWVKNTKAGESSPTFNLEPITDIHLYSHKPDELGSNGSFSSLIILITGAFIVFLLAIINFSNLNYVQFLTELKDFKIRMINGASLLDLSKIQFSHSLLQTSLAVVLGGSIAYNFNQFTHFSFHLEISPSSLLLISVLFFVIFGITSLLPLFTNKISKNLSSVPAGGSKKFVGSLLFQFMLSIAAIITTIVLHKQMDFINHQHPGTEKASIVIIPNVPYPMIAKYEVLKELCLKHPEVRNFSASTYQPGTIAPLLAPIEMEGLNSEEEKKLTILSIDTDFFELFGIKALAGSLDMGVTSSVAWEQIAIGIHNYNPHKDQLLQELNQYTKEHGGFKEKYILNKSALNLLGIKRPEDAIGKQFKINFDAIEMFPKGEVIAVVDDFHYGDLFTKEEPLVLAAKKLFNSTFIAKIDPNRKAEAIKILEKEWNQVDPEHPFKYEFVTDLYARIYTNQYNEMRALTLFSILSIILSTLGMFALSSFSIQHKTKEIGIRKANGSSSLEILLQLIREYTQWVFISFVIACPIAFYITSDWLSNFVYRTELSWWIFALSGLLALGIAILTISWQTWKAANQNPVEALKYE